MLFATLGLVASRIDFWDWLFGGRWG